MKLGEQVTILERDFKDLTKLWERFFAGDLRVPPVKERERLQRRLRILVDRPGVARRADTFRLEQLQHRFATYNQNWERMLREKEEGRGRAFVARGQRPAPTPQKPNASPADAVHKENRDSLFDRFREAKAGLGQNMDMDRTTFENKIGTQKKALEAKLGTSVRFDVLVEDGKVKLAAKKIKRST